MADMNGVLARLRPCDTSSPYVFISYSSADRETVWTDALEFQKNGYNIWLDEKNLDKTKSSWKDDALRAIGSRRCQLVVFYVSAASLCSAACLREMRETRAERTVKNHFAPVPFLVVEAERIGNIVSFCQQVHGRLDREIADEDEFEQKAQTLMDFKEDFFNGNNERVRIQPRSDPDRKGSYYEDIQNFFPDKTRLSAPEEPDSSPQPPPDPGPREETSAAGDLHVVKTLGTTDVKYNICTFGSAFHIGWNQPVAVVIGGKRYERKMHSTGKGRMDGMKQIYADHGLGLGDVLDARYSAAERTVYLTKLPRT